MKKIVTSRGKEEKEKRMRTWMAIIIVVILAASSAGFALNFVNTKSVSYNGLKFSQTDQGWQPKGFSMLSTYLPQDLDNVTSEGSFSTADFSSKAYVIFPPYMQSSTYELIRSLPLQNVQAACLPEDEGVSYCTDLTLKSCGDANSQSSVIIFRESNETSVKYSGYCLELSGDSGSILQAVDKALFIANGIMK